MNVSGRWVLVPWLLLGSALPATADVDRKPQSVEFEAVYPRGARPRPKPLVIASQHDALLGKWNLGGGTGSAHATNDPNFHPAVRVFVRTRALRPLGNRGLTDRGVQAQVRHRGYWPLRLCYEDALRAEPDARGEVVMRFSIGRNGRVTYVRPIRSGLSSGANRCVRRALYGVRFKPWPQRRVDVEFSVRLNPGDARVLPLPQSTARATPAERSVFQAAQQWIAQCYRAGLARDPSLWGRLELELTLSPEGRVGAVREGSSRFADRAVVACARERLQKHVVANPAPSEPRQLTVAYRMGSPPVQDDSTQKTD